jgi:hypothetical protein
MRRIVVGGLLAAAALVAAAPASAAKFVVTAEAPDRQTTSTTFSYSGVESFDSRTVTGTGSTSNFTTNFGSSRSGITGTYSGVSIVNADQYGGAGGSGRYATIQQNGSSPVSYTLNLSTSQSQGINYFGMWLSAIDAGNTFSFYNGNTLLYTFSAADLLNQFGSTQGSDAYYGNPNTGANSGEGYAFLNFYSTESIFTKVVLTESRGGSGFESDNHTVGRYTSMSGYQVNTSAVPEPGTWVLMLGGFGAIGFAMRRKIIRTQAIMA